MKWRDLLVALGVADPQLPEKVREATSSKGLSRRAFLTGVGTTAIAALVVDPEQFLWTPGEKTFFLPPVVKTATIEDIAAFGQDFAAEQYAAAITPEWVTREALKILEQELDLGKRMLVRLNRPYDCAKIGETVLIRFPQRFNLSQQQVVLSQQQVVDTVTPVTITDQLYVTSKATRSPLGNKDIDPKRIINQELRPAMKRLAQEIKRRGVNVFSEMVVPPYHEAFIHANTVTDRNGQLSLRMLEAYDPIEGSITRRFDVIGGSVPEGLLE